MINTFEHHVEQNRKNHRRMNFEFLSGTYTGTTDRRVSRFKIEDRHQQTENKLMNSHNL